jgi:hypothetical protein
MKGETGVVETEVTAPVQTEPNLCPGSDLTPRQRREQAVAVGGCPLSEARVTAFLTGIWPVAQI